MKKLQKGLLLAYLLIGYLTVYGQHSFDSKSINNYLNKIISDQQLHGAVVLVGSKENILFEQAYGKLSIERNIDMPKDAIFRIASMTKLLTCAGLMTLYEDGEFLLSDPVSKYIPAFSNQQVVVRVNNSTGKLETKPAENEVTILDLLLHTSGIGYMFGGESVYSLYEEAGYRQWNKSAKDFALSVAKQPLMFEPGSQWHYSYSTDIIGYLIEVISGKSLDIFLNERLFAPLKMFDTGFFVPQEKLVRLSSHYIYKEGTLQLEEDGSSGRFSKKPAGLSGGGGWNDGYGGIVTTAQDLAKFLQMILNNGELNSTRILSKNTIEFMYKDHIAEIDKRLFPVSGYGLGTGVIANEQTELGSIGDIYWAGGPYNTYFYLSFQNGFFGILLVQNAPFGHLDMMDKFSVILQSSIRND